VYLDTVVADICGGQIYTLPNGLSASVSGTYVAALITRAGCDSTIVTQLTVWPVLSIQLDTAINVTCNSDSDGAVLITALGGIAPYSYQWDNGLGNVEDPKNLRAGTYSVTVTDSTGCNTSLSVTLSQDFFTAGFESEDNACFGDAQGIIRGVNVQGGDGNYGYSLDGVNYQWSNEFKYLTAGNYTLYVKDGQGCTTSMMVTITEPAELMVDLGPDLEMNFGDSLQLNPQVINGMAPFEFIWTPSAGLSCDSCANPWTRTTSPRQYFVTVIDANGCMATTDIRVLVGRQQPVFIPNGFTPNGDGTNDIYTVFGNSLITNVPVMRIYDRWGGLVFEGKNLKAGDETMGWDGTIKGQGHFGELKCYNLPLIILT